ncbi:peptidoglycan-recognition protein LA-like isoform X2 [Macrosteles quadrilineatus]|uniref:peptidoglycan-recognition protein LA-like isoform X2 n=1 Tax=Macrosteles quadrilineatus TaxID=74068 RepID=UPI0023E1BEFA|nr:peptidoglycan-recognition protein LA-like isoform X2 [Macrosteles quadrilineatus]
MSSPRPSLVSTSSVVSTSSDCSDEEAKVAPLRRSSPKSQTTVNVGQILVDKNADVPGVLNGTLRKTTLNFFINHGLDGDADVNDLVTDAVKIKSETVKTFIPDYNSSYKLNGTKEDVEGLSRRWCYLISALVTLSLITLLGTAVLSLTNWKTSQSGTLSPDIQKSIDGLSAEEKYFAAVRGAPTVAGRTEWVAQPSKWGVPNPLPIKRVVVSATNTDPCRTTPQCTETVRTIQMVDVEQLRQPDIHVNFLIGGDGKLYWGRGFATQGNSTKDNNQTVEVELIGDFSENGPSKEMTEVFQQFVDAGIRSGLIAKDYALLARCQLVPGVTVGLELLRDVEKWPQYESSGPYPCTR